MKKYFIKYINGSVEMRNDNKGIEENIQRGLIDTFADMEKEIVLILTKNEQGQMVMREFNLNEETGKEQGIELRKTLKEDDKEGNKGKN